MERKDISRRRVLASGTAAVVGSITGCQGLFGTPASGDAETTDQPSETPTNTTTPANGEIFADDFESGNLNNYTVGEFDGDDGTESYFITTNPSQGDYAVRHRTETEYMTPTEAVTLEPPLTFSLDFYISGWSGVEIALQYDEGEELFYIIRVRNNTNGNHIQVQKWENYYQVDGREKLKGSENLNAVFEGETWETVTIQWEDDGTIDAGIESTGEGASIMDSELSGERFYINGYHYDGWAAFDNIDITR